MILREYYASSDVLEALSEKRESLSLAVLFLSSCESVREITQYGNRSWEREGKCRWSKSEYSDCDPDEESAGSCELEDL